MLLTEEVSFIYKAKLDNDLYEHELDHVLFGTTDLPQINKKVADYKYSSFRHTTRNEEHPDRYATWFKICFDEVLKKEVLPINFKHQKIGLLGAGSWGTAIASMIPINTI